MNGLVKRIRRVSYDERFGHMVVTSEWTRENGWTYPQADATLAAVKAKLARMQEIDTDNTNDEPLDARQLWGGPPPGGYRVAPASGPRNVRYTSGTGRNTRFSG